MKKIETGIKGSADILAEESSSAAAMGSGSLRVFATPAMIALMEKAACDCLTEYLENDETTVGTELNIRHTSATPIGMTVRAEAVLMAVSGREFTFEIRAYDKSGEIGVGEHKRFLVFGEKFVSKTYSKLNK